MSDLSEKYADLGLGLLEVRQFVLADCANNTPAELVNSAIAGALREVERRFTLEPRSEKICFKECELAMYYFDLVNDEGEG